MFQSSQNRPNNKILDGLTCWLHALRATSKALLRAKRYALAPPFSLNRQNPSRVHTLPAGRRGRRRLSQTYTRRRSRADPTCALALTPFGARAGFCERLFFCLSTRSTRQHLSQTIRAYDWWEAGAPRARARSHTRFARVIECKLSPRAFIGQELFWNFVKRYTGNCPEQGAF